MAGPYYSLGNDDWAGVASRYGYQWKAYAVAKKLPNAGTVVTNDPIEATYVGIHMWKQAVEKAGSTDSDCLPRGLCRGSRPRFFV